MNDGLTPQRLPGQVHHDRQIGRPPPRRPIALVRTRGRLYRYFPSKGAILAALIIDAHDDLGAAAEQALARAQQRSVLERRMAICHGVRDWSLDHPQECSLIFGTPVPEFEASADAVGPASRVPALLTGLLVEMVGTGEYDLIGQLPISDDVRRALSPVREKSPPRYP
ncbi:TetR-like C-terminal domain-containing protein [Kineosporia sp. NBRC 101731]|uniref:TetR/AcrR family transcriptional regulator n=1 Tax=Kineosporia sp. NBRC 101731 TaxID=3032199 RepID=UPI00255752D6|nr:TetR-like C-terminal domain-containing protein [Kineosporia sp. NBRC 101731]